MKNVTAVLCVNLFVLSLDTRILDLDWRYLVASLIVAVYAIWVDNETDKP